MKAQSIKIEAEVIVPETGVGGFEAIAVLMYDHKNERLTIHFKQQIPIEEGMTIIDKFLIAKDKWIAFNDLR